MTAFMLLAVVDRMHFSQMPPKTIIQSDLTSDKLLATLYTRMLDL